MIRRIDHRKSIALIESLRIREYVSAASAYSMASTISEIRRFFSTCGRY